MREAARASALAPSRDASPTTALQCIGPCILTAPSRCGALGKLPAEQLRVDTRRRAHRVRRTLGCARSARTVRRGDACPEAPGGCSASKLGALVALLHTSRRPHREQSTERVSRPSAYLVGRPAISFARPTWRGAAGMESCGLGKKCDIQYSIYIRVLCSRNFHGKQTDANGSRTALFANDGVRAASW